MSKWHVTRQTPVAGGMQVAYQMEDGTEHEVYVSNNDLTVTGVKKRINDLVNARDAIATLTSDS